MSCFNGIESKGVEAQTSFSRWDFAARRCALAIVGLAPEMESAVSDLTRGDYSSVGL